MAITMAAITATYVTILPITVATATTATHQTAPPTRATWTVLAAHPAPMVAAVNHLHHHLYHQHQPMAPPQPASLRPPPTAPAIPTQLTKTAAVTTTRAVTALHVIIALVRTALTMAPVSIRADVIIALVRTTLIKPWIRTINWSFWTSLWNCDNRYLDYLRLFIFPFKN